MNYCILILACFSLFSLSCTQDEEPPKQAPINVDMSSDSDMLVDMVGDTSSDEMSDQLKDVTSDEIIDVQIDDALFVSLPSIGRVGMVLHPHDKVVAGVPVRVDVTIPFPKNTLTDASFIQVREANRVEVSSHGEAIAYWRSPTDGKPLSVRAARVSFMWTFDSTEPVAATFVYGLKPTVSFDTAQSTPTSYPISESTFFPDEYDASAMIGDANVSATFSPKWLGASLLRTRTGGQWPNFAEDTLTSFAQSAVNDVRDHVTEPNKIPHQSAYAPWLFDRAGTLWNVYILTGEVKWLRHASRATQFYRSKVSSTGYFSLKSSNDVKYSYNQSMFIAYMLTGDESYPDVIKSVAQSVKADGFNALYEARFNFWTERHLAYKALASLVAWELTGDPSDLNDVTSAIEHNLQQTKTPSNQWAAIGCILHSLKQHEGVSKEDPVCSPWMSALYGDVLWRAYLVADSQPALEQLSLYGDFLNTHGVYMNDGKALPYYIRGPQYDSVSGGASSPSSDAEHACDVAGFAYRTAYAKTLRNEDPQTTLVTAGALMNTCESVVPSWIRTSQATIDAGKTFYRLAPPRKFNWWFGTTSDLGWFAK